MKTAKAESPIVLPSDSLVPLRSVLCTEESGQAKERPNAALSESERRFREMVNALPAAIYTTDAEGRLTHFNPAAAEFSGRTPELVDIIWPIGNQASAGDVIAAVVDCG